MDTIIFFSSPSLEKSLENISIDVNPLFDIVVIYYKKIKDKKVKSSKLIDNGLENFKSLFFELEGKGQVLQKIDEFLNVNKLYKKYKYVGIFDDDLVCSFSGINEILSIAKKYKLDSLQPSLTKDSVFTHKFTLKRDKAILHYVKWVEIMCPIYDSNLFKLSAPYFKESISSWGLDCYVFPIVSRINSYTKHAVIDKVSVSHIRDMRSTKTSYSNGLKAEEECEKLRISITKFLHKTHPNFLAYEDIESTLTTKYLYKKNTNKIDKSFKNITKNKFDDSIITGTHHTWNRFKFSSILISTNSDIDRLKSTKKHLKNLDINHLNHEAVIYKTLKNVLLEDTNLVSKSKVSQICCFVSHIFAIEQILKSSSDDIFLILEDDVRLFPDPYLVGLEKIINNKDWEIVTFEHNMPYTFLRLRDAFNHGNLLQRWDNPKDYGASAYFITRDFAKKIVNYFLKDTSEGSKIDLKKTYVYHRPIVPDYLVFDLGNTLISTFPIALQNPDFLSEIGYENTYDMAKISAINEVVKLWKSYYKYN